MRLRQIQALRSPSRCPWCHDDLADTKDLAACALCGARHHRGCHDEYGACASCGASEALYPPASPTRRRVRGRPPIGSKIRVWTRGNTTTYAWPTRNQWNWFFAVLLSLVPPIGLYMIWHLFNPPDRSLVLTANSIGFSTETGRKRIPRAQLGAVKAQTTGNGSFLTIDHGITRHLLTTGVLLPTLSAPELEWLAEQINAWKG